MDEWLFEVAFTFFTGLPQLFLLHKDLNLNSVMLVKVVDDLLINGTYEDVQTFLNHVQRRFNVCRIIHEEIYIYS